MKSYRIVSVEPLAYPTLLVTFDDGLSGVFDLSEKIDQGQVFAPLKDETFFRTAAVGEHGRTFGWNLDDIGNEIDLCPDTARIAIETRIVEDMAARFHVRRTAAE